MIDDEHDLRLVWLEVICSWTKPYCITWQWVNLDMGLRQGWMGTQIDRSMILIVGCVIIMSVWGRTICLPLQLHLEFQCRPSVELLINKMEIIKYFDIFNFADAEGKKKLGINCEGPKAQNIVRPINHKPLGILKFKCPFWVFHTICIREGYNCQNSVDSLLGVLFPLKLLQFVGVLFPLKLLEFFGVLFPLELKPNIFWSSEVDLGHACDAPLMVKKCTGTEGGPIHAYSHRFVISKHSHDLDESGTVKCRLSNHVLSISPDTWRLLDEWAA